MATPRCTPSDDALELLILSTDFYGNAGYYGSGDVLCPQTWDSRVAGSEPTHANNERKIQ